MLVAIADRPDRCLAVAECLIWSPVTSWLDSRCKRYARGPRPCVDTPADHVGVARAIDVGDRRRAHGTRRRGAPAAPSAGLGVAAADLAFSDLVLWVLDRDPDASGQRRRSGRPPVRRRWRTTLRATSSRTRPSTWSGPPTSWGDRADQWGKAAGRHAGGRARGAGELSGPRDHRRRAAHQPARGAAPSTLKSAYLESADEGRQHLLAPEDRRLADLELSGADRAALAQCAEFGQ